MDVPNCNNYMLQELVLTLIWTLLSLLKLLIDRLLARAEAQLHYLQRGQLYLNGNIYLFLTPSSEVQILCH